MDEDYNSRLRPQSPRRNPAVNDAPRTNLESTYGQRTSSANQDQLVSGAKDRFFVGAGAHRPKADTQYGYQSISASESQPGEYQNWENQIGEYQAGKTNKLYRHDPSYGTTDVFAPRQSKQCKRSGPGEWYNSQIDNSGMTDSYQTASRLMPPRHSMPLTFYAPLPIYQIPSTKLVTINDLVQLMKVTVGRPRITNVERVLQQAVVGDGMTGERAYRKSIVRFQLESNGNDMNQPSSQEYSWENYSADVHRPSIDYNAVLSAYVDATGHQEVKRERLTKRRQSDDDATPYRAHTQSLRNIASYSSHFTRPALASQDRFNIQSDTATPPQPPQPQESNADSYYDEDLSLYEQESSPALMEEESPTVLSSKYRGDLDEEFSDYPRTLENDNAGFSKLFGNPQTESADSPDESFLEPFTELSNYMDYTDSLNQSYQEPSTGPLDDVNDPYSEADESFPAVYYGRPDNQVRTKQNYRDHSPLTISSRDGDYGEETEGSLSERYMSERSPHHGYQRQTETPKLDYYPAPSSTRHDKRYQDKSARFYDNQHGNKSRTFASGLYAEDPFTGEGVMTSEGGNVVRQLVETNMDVFDTPPLSTTIGYNTDSVQYFADDNSDDGVSAVYEDLSQKRTQDQIYEKIPSNVFTGHKKSNSDHDPSLQKVIASTLEAFRTQPESLPDQDMLSEEEGSISVSASEMIEGDSKHGNNQEQIQKLGTSEFEQHRAAWVCTEEREFVEAETFAEIQGEFVQTIIAEPVTPVPVKTAVPTQTAESSFHKATNNQPTTMIRSQAVEVKLQDAGELSSVIPTQMAFANIDEVEVSKAKTLKAPETVNAEERELPQTEKLAPTYAEQIVLQLTENKAMLQAEEWDLSEVKEIATAAGSQVPVFENEENVRSDTVKQMVSAQYRNTALTKAENIGTTEARETALEETSEIATISGSQMALIENERLESETAKQMVSTLYRNTSLVKAKNIGTMKAKETAFEEASEIATLSGSQMALIENQDKMATERAKEMTTALHQKTPLTGAVNIATTNDMGEALEETLVIPTFTKSEIALIHYQATLPTEEVEEIIATLHREMNEIEDRHIREEEEAARNRAEEEVSAQSSEEDTVSEELTESSEEETQISAVLADRSQQVSGYEDKRSVRPLPTTNREELSRLVAAGTARTGQMLVQHADNTFEMIEVLHLNAAESHKDSDDSPTIEIEYVGDGSQKQQKSKTETEKAAAGAQERLRAQSHVGKVDDRGEIRRRSSANQQQAKTTQCPVQRATIALQTPADRKSTNLKSMPEVEECPAAYAGSRESPVDRAMRRMYRASSHFEQEEIVAEAAPTHEDDSLQTTLPLDQVRSAHAVISTARAPSSTAVITRHATDIMFNTPRNKSEVLAKAAVSRQEQSDRMNDSNTEEDDVRASRNLSINSRRSRSRSRRRSRSRSPSSNERTENRHISSLHRIASVEEEDEAGKGRRRSKIASTSTSGLYQGDIPTTFVSNRQLSRMATTSTSDLQGRMQMDSGDGANERHRNIETTNSNACPQQSIGAAMTCCLKSPQKHDPCCDGGKSASCSHHMGIPAAPLTQAICNQAGIPIVNPNCLVPFYQSSHPMLGGQCPFVMPMNSMGAIMDPYRFEAQRNMQTMMYPGLLDQLRSQPCKSPVRRNSGSSKHKSSKRQAVDINFTMKKNERRSSDWYGCN